MLLRQWARRPGRAAATIASVAVAVGAVVATWVSADASRTGYRRLTEAVEGFPTVDVAARGGGRFNAQELPSLADIPGVRAVVPLFTGRRCYGWVSGGSARWPSVSRPRP